MFVNNRWIKVILNVAVTAVVIISWTYTLYTARITGLQFLENRFGRSVVA